MARKQRYDRWERRRSVAKINTILDRVKYHKALAKQATSNAALAPIFEGKGSPAAGAGAGAAEQGKKA